MRAYRLSQLASPDILGDIPPPVLLRFLRPYRPYLQDRGLDHLDDLFPEEFDHEHLAYLLNHPDDQMPHGLVTALHLVNELATPQGMNGLLDDLEQDPHPPEIPADVTPAEVALRVWMHNPRVIERRHAREFVTRALRFEHFQPDTPHARLYNPTDGLLRTLESRLDAWFLKKRRGTGCGVMVFHIGEEVWFLVRHGLPFARTQSLREAKVTSLCFRPLQYDRVVYHRRWRDLRINANLRGEIHLYRTQFADVLFDRPVEFRPSAKYTLEPLRDHAAGALVCTDIDGIESIVLAECHIPRGGSSGIIDITRGPDLFGEPTFRIAPGPPIERAKFDVRFAESQKPRAVWVHAGNISRYTRDGDAQLIEAWLRARGFLSPVGVTLHDPLAPLLDCA